jgi:thioredoxin 1
MKIIKASMHMAVLGIGLLLFAGMLGSCSKETKKPQKPSLVQQVKSNDHFSAIVKEAKDTLVIFDLYADWCVPCRIVSPMLEQLAATYKGQVDVYKVNVDNLPQVASYFGGQGIPYVIFIRQQKVLFAIMGARPFDAYRKAIDYLLGGGDPQKLSIDDVNE